MVLVALLQSILFFATIILGGTISRLNNNAIDILNERVINRKNYLQNEMLRWSNLDEAANLINTTVNETIKEYGVDEFALTEDNEISSIVINNIYENLIYVLRKQASTGVFVAFNGDDAIYGSQLDEKAGLYLRDSNPSTVSENNADITIVRGAPSVTKKINLPLDVDWTSNFEMYTNREDDEYFFKPLREVRNRLSQNYRDLGYWSKPFKTGENSPSVMTYTVPLINSKGIAYGVLGIELSTDYIKKILPYDELIDDKAGTYIIALKTGEGELTPIVKSGPMLERVLGGDEATTFQMEPVKGNDYQVVDVDNDLYGCVQNFKLYNSNTAFENEQWALVGVLEGNKLFCFSNNVQMGLIVAGIISLIVGAIVVVLSAKMITNPIDGLIKSLRASNPTSAIKLKKTEIREIDELAQAVEQLGNSVVESSSKLTRIIQMASVKLGAFEHRNDTNQVFITKPFFEIFGTTEPETNNGYIPSTVFNEYMKQFEDYIEVTSRDSNIYKIPIDDSFIWVRMRRVFDNTSSFGTIEDITQEIIEKKKIEYDRDHDLLTGLCNRRAFMSKLNDLFNGTKSLDIGAMMMIDLDNLKHINDTFGHECGDQYLIAVANAIKKTMTKKSIVARMSGDEFYIFVYGYDTESEAEVDINKIKNELYETYFILGDGSPYRIRASIGMAWYPRDTDSYDILIRYADFAMYTVKNTVKGELRHFDAEEYKKNAYLLQNKEELNKFIENKLIDYHLQPIVDTKTGEIFAYEALMRSKLKSLRSPFEILTLARSQFKLYQIEKLTWFGALDKFASLEGIGNDCKLFINSIPNQMLSYTDMVDIEKNYKPYLSRLVIELTEEEKQDESFISTKQTYARTWNASIALDDFGSGYNSDIMLLYLAPEYVKIDMTIVRDIDKDKNRLKILQNLISYTAERKIKVIAEGVETYEEMKTLIENDVDYLQGFYLGMPSPQPQMIPNKIIDEIKALSHFETNI